MAINIGIKIGNKNKNIKEEKPIIPIIPPIKDENQEVENFVSKKRSKNLKNI